MKKIITLLLITISFKSYCQDNKITEHSFIETVAKVDTLVIADRFFITISVTNENKKSTTEFEFLLKKKLKELKIDTDNNLKLLETHQFKKPNVSKYKYYSLLVYDTVIAERAIKELEDVGISNVTFERSEYSKSEELLLELKTLAISKAKKKAILLAASSGKKIGRTIYINDNYLSFIETLQSQVKGMNITSPNCSLGSTPIRPTLSESKKVKYKSQVSVKFELE